MALDFATLRRVGHFAIRDISGAETATYRTRTVTSPGLGLDAPTTVTSDTTVHVSFARYRKKDIDGGTLTGAEDRTVYISAVDLDAAGVTPKKEDEIIHGGQRFQIVFLQPNEPGNHIWYKARLRR
jgi:hypothetical protein